jgi:hypothetical protein
MMKRSPKPAPQKKKVGVKFLAYAKSTKFDESGDHLDKRLRIIRKPLPQWEYDFNELPNEGADSRSVKRSDSDKARIKQIAFHEFGREDWRNYQPHLLETNTLPVCEMDRIHGKGISDDAITSRAFDDLGVEMLSGADWGFEEMKDQLQHFKENHCAFKAISYHAVQIDWRNNKEDIVASFQEWMDRQPESKSTQRGKTPWAVMNAQLDWLAAWRAQTAGYTYDDFKSLLPRPRKVYADKYVFNEACKKAEKIIVEIAKGVPVNLLLGMVDRG